MDTKDQESRREAATTTEGTTSESDPPENQNSREQTDRRDTNGKAWAFGPITRWRLAVNNRNVAIYNSSDQAYNETND